MRGAELALSGTIAALGSCAAMALPSAAFGASDAASTEAYVRANYALVQAGHGYIPTVHARIAQLRQRLRGECPAIVTGSPRNTDSEQLTWEVVGAMAIVGYQSGATAAARFARAVSKLSWSNAALTRAVRSYARRGLAEVRTPVPDVCADLAAWKASGYKTLPASTVSFRKTFFEDYVGIGFLPKALRPYLKPSQSAMLRSTKRDEDAIAEAEAREVRTFGEITDSLGL